MQFFSTGRLHSLALCVLLVGSFAARAAEPNLSSNAEYRAVMGRLEAQKRAFDAAGDQFDKINAEVQACLGQMGPLKPGTSAYRRATAHCTELSKGIPPALDRMERERIALDQIADQSRALVKRLKSEGAAANQSPNQASAASKMPLAVKPPKQTAGGSCVPADDNRCVNTCGRAYPVKLCFDKKCETRSVSPFGQVGKQLDPASVKTHGDFVSATPMCK